MLRLRSRLRGIARQHGHWLRLSRKLKRPLTLPEMQACSLSRKEQYYYCLYYFDWFLPESIREHRRYFVANQRGFGEDAFHAMWFLLFQEFRPVHALEIGVYRGQTITLWKLLSRHFGINCQVGCVSPFTSAGDSVSRYEERVDFHEDMLHNHRHFGIDLPEVCRHYSTAAEARQFVRGRQWDIIYIDGNHDYSVARQDWDLSVGALAPRGIIVLDDAALDTDFRPPSFATAGHPGPSRLAQEIDPSQFQEILSVGHNRVFQRL